MSVETEVKAAVTAVEGEAKAVEGTVANKLAEVVKVVEGEAKAVANDTKQEVNAAFVNISTEEKLVLREAELEYVKAQMEIQRLTKITETKTKEYTTFIESLLKKYTLDKGKYVFDAVINAFKKL